MYDSKNKSIFNDPPTFDPKFTTEVMMKEFSRKLDIAVEQVHERIDKMSVTRGEQSQNPPGVHRRGARMDKEAYYEANIFGYESLKRKPRVRMDYFMDERKTTWEEYERHSNRFYHSRREQPQKPMDRRRERVQPREAKEDIMEAVRNGLEACWMKPQNTLKTHREQVQPREVKIKEDHATREESLVTRKATSV